MIGRSIKPQLPLQRILDVQTDLTYKQWKEDYEKLRKEHNTFRDYFDKNRTCRCNIDLCRHLEKIEKNMFNPKYYELVNRHIVLGLNTISEYAPELFEKTRKSENSVFK
ncbi:MAG: hypothetical protein IIC67_11545 [Thaumarchaeota archaeon]|nr:hypothetical protein [Nitrososphaerota archaeon]